MKAEELARMFRVGDGTKFSLDRFDPADTNGLDIDKSEAKELLASNMDKMRKLQERLYAEGKWAILIVLQAMDAGGKDSAIEHVMTGINPQGCDVKSFKQPGPIELKHDFLWRHVLALPQRGKIVIFNRSHYEEVLVVRVHPGILDGQGLPKELRDKDIWKRRFRSIRDFERHLVESGTAVLKFYLHISKDEQARRFLDRIDQPEKHWKFSFGDLEERKYWDAYMDAYEDMIRNTATEDAPWHVVPANNKWYARMVISSALAEALEALDPKFPKVEDDYRRRLAAARGALAAEAGKGRKG